MLKSLQKTISDIEFNLEFLLIIRYCIIIDFNAKSPKFFNNSLFLSSQRRSTQKGIPRISFITDCEYLENF